MKKVDYLVIQSTETREVKHLDKGYIIDTHTSSIREGGFGFNRPGIDYLILQDGTLETIVSEDSPTTVDLWGVSTGNNGISGIVKHIAYAGGRTLKEAWSKDSRTEAQSKTLEAIVRFYILRFPEIVVLGFDEIASKSESENPAFSVSKWLSELAISEKNIYKK